MALDQSALIEVLEALRAADVDDRVCQAAQTIYQALIEAELTAVIGAAPGERTDVPYVFLDATYCTARVNRRGVSQAVVVATGCAPTAAARS